MMPAEGELEDELDVDFREKDDARPVDVLGCGSCCNFRRLRGNRITLQGYPGKSFVSSEVLSETC